MSKNMQTMLTGMGTIALLAVWWLFLTKLRWRTRLGVLALVAAVAFGAKQLIRVDGAASGSGRPVVVWKWTPKRSGNIGEYKPAAKDQSLTLPAAEYPGYLGVNRSGVVEGVELDPDWTARPPKEI